MNKQIIVGSSSWYKLALYNWGQWHWANPDRGSRQPMVWLSNTLDFGQDNIKFIPTADCYQLEACKSKPVSTPIHPICINVLCLLLKSPEVLYLFSSGVKNTYLLAFSSVVGWYHKVIAMFSSGGYCNPGSSPEPGHLFLLVVFDIFVFCLQHSFSLQSLLAENYRLKVNTTCRNLRAHLWCAAKKCLTPC